MVRAAESVGLTQPAVTKAVRDLEGDLGVALFERGNRGVTPTIYGEALVRHAHRVLAQLVHAAEEIDDLAHGAGGRVAIGTLLAASAWLLPRAIARLRAERPRVVVDVVEGTHDRLQPMLARGDLDMVVGRLSEFRHRAGVRQEPIYSEEIVILARPAHRLAHHGKLSLADLQEADWILPPPETTLRRQLEKALLRCRPGPAQLRGSVGVAAHQPATAVRQRPHRGLAAGGCRGRSGARPSRLAAGSPERDSLAGGRIDPQAGPTLAGRGGVAVHAACGRTRFGEEWIYGLVISSCNLFCC